MPLPPTRSHGVRRLLAELNATRLSLTADETSGERRNQLLGQVTEYLLVSLVVLVIAGIEVGRWYFETPPQPLLVCAFAVALISYAAVRVWFILPQLRILAREREARRSLKAALTHICAKGYVLFEGVADPRGWLVGSVIAGPTGIFCLVSRYIPRGHDLSEKLEHLSDSSLHLAGREIMADPLTQARRAAASLYEMLATAGLETVPVQAIVVFPGWTIERADDFSDREIIVANEQSLESEIRQSATRIEPRQVIAVSLLLEKAARIYTRPTSC